MTRGCTCDALTVDDERIFDFTDEKKSEILDYLLGDSKLRGLYKPENLQEFIYDLAEEFGEYDYIGHCEQCGDSIEEFTLTI